MIERTALLSKLAIVAPALAKTDFTPLLTEFWFTGSRVMAFNEQLAISVPLKTEFRGSVRGDALLSLLKLSKARTIEMIVADDNLNIKAASTKIKLGMHPREQSINVFKMPKFDESKPTIKITEALIDGIRAALRSVSNDSTTPDKAGVTILPTEGGGFDLYSTDDVTMSRIHFATSKSTLKKRMIITTAFCDQLISRFDADQAKASMQFADDYVLAHFGDIEIFGHVIETESPLDFQTVFSHHYNDKMAKKFVPIPSKLNGISERAAMISEVKTGRTKTKISVADGKASFYSASPMGEVRDHTTLGEGHPNVSVLAEARFLKTALPHHEELLITSEAILLRRGPAVHMISASAADERKAAGNAIRRGQKTGAGAKKSGSGGDIADEDIPF